MCASVVCTLLKLAKQPAEWALFFHVFQASEGKRETSEERETRATGEDTCLALLARFALRSPEKTQKKKIIITKNACFAG